MATKFWARARRAATAVGLSAVLVVPIVGITATVAEASSSIDNFASVPTPASPDDVTMAPSVSSDGSKVAYVAEKGSPGSGDYGIYYRDFSNSTPVLASVPAPGGTNSDDNRSPDISGNGRYVVWVSSAKLVPEKTTQTFEDVFVRDMQTSTTKRLSVPYTGSGNPNGHAHAPQISLDGRYVVWFSEASNLVPGDNNNITDAFRLDRDSNNNGVLDEPGATTLERLDFPHVSGNGMDGCQWPVVDAYMSGDGKTIAMDTIAEDLDGETCGHPFYTGKILDWHDSSSSAPVELSCCAGQPFGIGGFGPLSDNGRYMVGGSNSGALIAIFDFKTQRMVDLGAAAVTSQAIAISGDGRYAVYNNNSNTFLADSFTGATEALNAGENPGTPWFGAEVDFPAVSTGGRTTIALARNLGGNGFHYLQFQRDTSEQGVWADIRAESKTTPGNSSVRPETVPPKALFKQGKTTAGTSLSQIDLRDTSVSPSPLRNIPLRNIGLSASPLRNIMMLSEIPNLLPGGWPTLLAGTPFADQPLANISFGKLLDFMNANPTSTVAALKLSDVDLSASPLRNISMASVALGDATLGGLPLHNETTPTASYNGWCSAIAASGYSCSALGITQNSTVASVELAGVPLRNIPLRNIPLRNIDLTASPLRNIPLRNIKIDRSPLRNIPLRNINLSTSPLRNIPLRNIPLRNIDTNASPLRNIPLRNIAVAGSAIGALPLRNIPLRNIAEPSPLRNIPLRNIMAKTAGTTTPLPLRNIPLRNIPLRNIDANPSPLRNIPLRNIANANAVVDCEIVNCASNSSDTLQTAAEQVPTAIRSSATMGGIENNLDGYFLGDLGYYLAPDGTEIPLSAIADLLDGYTLGDVYELGQVTLGALIGAFGDFTLGDLGEYGDVTLAELQPDLPADITLADLLLGLLDPNDYPWEDAEIGPEFSEQYAEPALSIPITARGTIDAAGGVDFPNSTYQVDIDPKASYAEGSALVSINGGTPVAQEPVKIVEFTGYGLKWNLGTLHNGDTVEITLQVLPGDVSEILGTPAGVNIFGKFTAGGEDSGNVFAVDQDGNPTTVTISPSTNTSPATAQTVVPETLYFGRILGTETHYYQIPVPAKGTRLSVTVTGVGKDADLAIYQATSGDLTPSPDRAIGLNSDPVAETGSTGTTIENSPPEGLQDSGFVTPPGTSIVASSINRNDEDESVTFTQNNTSSNPYIVAIKRYQGAGSGEQFMLRVHQITPPPLLSCTPMTLPFASGATGTVPTTLPAGLNTLYLTNPSRLTALYDSSGADDADETIAATAALAANSADAGVGAVIPVDGNAAVQSAYGAWDASPCDPEKANDVVTAINTVITNLLNANPAAKNTLKSIVIVGADNVIPQARLTDATQKANENGYGGDLTRKDNKATPQTAAAFGQNVLSDNPYGSFSPIPWLERKLYVPDVALGRLVETPAEIHAAITQFQTAHGSLDPKTTLSAGYDFLNDGTKAVDTGFSNRITDVSKRTVMTDDQTTPVHWTKADLLAKLFPGGATATPSITALNAHFDQSRLLPALGGTPGATNHDTLSTDEVKTAAAASSGGVLSFAQRIVFSMGCHSGLSVPDTYLSSVANDNGLDWAQALNQMGAAVFVGNTGYGYGDTASVALTERLMALFARKLDGSVNIGQALSYAKQEYLGGLGLYGAFDEKVIHESTFYGLPMYKISPAATGNVVLPPLPVVAPDNAVGAGISSSSINAAPSFTSNTGPDGTTYDTAKDNNAALSTVGAPQVTQDHPLVPRIEYDATTNSGGLVAHGALITGLTSTTTTGVRATFSNPITDQSTTEPALHGDDVAFPAVMQNVTTYKDQNGQHQRLVLMPGQFTGDDDPATAVGTGSRRRFTAMSAKVLYTAASNTDFTAPELANISGTVAGTTATFTVKPTDAAGIALAQAMVLGNGGVWAPLTMTLQGDGSYKATQSVPSGTTSKAFFVQVVDKNGNVATSTNKGDNFVAASKAPKVHPLEAFGTWTVGQEVTVNATFDDTDSTHWTSYADFADGTGQINQTAGDGYAIAKHTFTQPGTYTVTVGVCDEATCSEKQITIVVGAGNAAPVVNAGTNANVNRNQLFTRDGSYTDDPSSTSWTGSVNYGDGNGTTFSNLPLNGTQYTLSHTYTATGTYHVTVKICDDKNLCGTQVFDIVVSPVVNAAPVIPQGGTNSVQVNNSFSRSGTWSDNDESTSWTGTVDWGDGQGTEPITLGTGTYNITHTWATTGSKSVTVSICDNQNACGTMTFGVLVTPPPQAPVIDGGGNATLVVNDTLTRTGSFVDPDSPMWNGTVSWGDNGTVTQPLVINAGLQTFPLSHQYTSVGTFTATIRICDTENLCGTDTFVVTVKAPNVAPNVPAQNAGTNVLGQTFSRSIAFTDPDSAPGPWTATVDWNDGNPTGPQPVTFTGTTVPLSHVFTSGGAHTVQVVVCDTQPKCTSVSFVVTVTVPNTTPVVTAGANASLPEGTALTRNGSFTDTGSTSWTGTVDWDDSTAVENLVINQTAKTFPLNHTFATTGPHTVVVTVCDNQNACGSSTFTLTVVANQTPLVNAGGGNINLGAGDGFTRAGNFTDADSTSWTATVDYGDGAGPKPLTLMGTSFSLSKTYTALGNYTVTVKVCDNGNRCGTASFQVSVADVTAPVVTGVVTPAPNGLGWGKANYTITWTATDAAPSSGGVVSPAPTTVSAEGKNQTITSPNVCDNAGNCAKGTVVVSLDKTKPAGTIDTPALAIILIPAVGQRLTGTATDSLSGIASVKVTYTSSLLGIGTETQGAKLACNATATSCTWNSSPALPGVYTMKATITDKAGNQFVTPATTLNIVL